MNCSIFPLSLPLSFSLPLWLNYVFSRSVRMLSRLFYVFILFFIFVFISFWERVICKRSTGLSQSSPNVVPSSSSSAFTSLCCKNCVVYITKVFYNLFSLRSHFLFGFFSCFFGYLFIWNLIFIWHVDKPREFKWQMNGQLSSAWISSPLNAQK